jgi:hypothetical protein
MIRYAHRYYLILITKTIAATSMNEVNASVSERSELTGQSIHHYHFRTSNAYKYIESNAITANGLVLVPTFCVY